jgi:hypothetical protein
MSTANMNLTLPTVTVTLGPTWANEVNAAFQTIDAHDHSSGKGVAITPSGLNLSSDLDFQFNSAFNLKSTKFQTQSSTLVGASNASSIYTVDGNLYYTTGSGIAVQITDGSSIITVPTSSDNFQFNNVASNLTINPADPYVIINLDCSVSRIITLPPASAVIPGRFYIIKDATNSSESFPATVNPDGSDEIDGNANDTLNSDGVARMYTSNGADGWSII